MNLDTRPCIHARVALALLEVVQAKDHPGEFLKGENIQQTMPRRLGLSSVVESQIQRHREFVRKRRKLWIGDLASLMELVLRRSDARELFFDMGVRLAQSQGVKKVRLLPRGLRYAVAKRRVRRHLRALFGRPVGGFISGRFTLEASATPLVQIDPTGKACELVAGFSQQVLSDTIGDKARVTKRACETQGDPSCRWKLAE